MANQPRDLLAREIDEELRREQLLKIWDKYGVYILAAALTVIVGIGGWKYYQHRQMQAREAASLQYIVALGDFAANKAFDARKRLESLAPGAPGGYAALARLRLAAYDGAEGSTIDALNAYEGIVKDRSVDPILRDYARLQIAMLKFDAIPFPELRTQLSSLVNDHSPWSHSALELLGMGAMKAGYPAEARNHFRRLLGDRTTPPGIADRVRVMVAMLDEADRGKGAPAGTADAEQKPETPSKAGPDKGKAEVGPGKTK